MALSAGDRVLALTTADSNLGDTRSRAGSRGTMLAPAARLDEVLPDAVFDLVKIDVQGFELEVIGGHDRDAASAARRSSSLPSSGHPPCASADLDPIQVLKDYRDLDLTFRTHDRHRPRSADASRDSARLRLGWSQWAGESGALRATEPVRSSGAIAFPTAGSRYGTREIVYVTVRWFSSRYAMTPPMTAGQVPSRHRYLLMLTRGHGVGLARHVLGRNRQVVDT